MKDHMKTDANLVSVRGRLSLGALGATTACLLLAGSLTTVRAHDDGDRGPNAGREHQNSHTYQQFNLVSDQAGVAMLQDTNLVNAWGISFGPTSPFWVSANGTGKALLYAVTNDEQGAVVVTKVGLEVTIPGDGTPTGQVFNNQGGFNGDIFLFVSEDGTISGWRQSLGNTAELLTNRSTAVYKGVTLAATDHGAVLLAANFAEATIDAYDANANLVGQFSDAKAPAGFAPFNVQQLEGMVLVTFAKQDADKHDDVAGPGNGLIDLFYPSSGKFVRLATGSNAGGKLSALNSPWGLALAPADFGKHSDQLLVGNFGSGTVMTFDDRGRFRGLLRGADQKPLVIDGLWGLTVGNGGRAGTPNTLFFSAGPEDESHGLFGIIAPIDQPNRHDGD